MKNGRRCKYTPSLRRNVIIYWIGCFSTSCGLSVVILFVFLYIEELGIDDVNKLA
ncbi:MFS transporter [Bacillus pseudomycoides]|nr:MFS transporter [Bacillus pseudomycoides]PGS09290.1 MFS transporter [Bacillus pseudomycoides]PHC95258.1 MFS transporter [Bacillus pseudomycoides]